MTTVFFFVVSLLTLFFYIIGNAQGFTDSTLRILFILEIRVLAICIIAGILTIISYLVSIPHRTRPMVVRMIGSGVLVLISIVLYLGVALLWVFMESYG